MTGWDNVDEQEIARARHDLRTVVNHLEGYVLLLREDGEPWVRNAASGEALDRIEEASREILRVLDAQRVRRRGASPGQILQGFQLQLVPPADAVDEAVAALAGLGPPEGHPDIDRLRQASLRLRTFLETGAVHAHDRASHGPPSGKPASKGRVLVVEDDDGNRELIDRMLRRECYEVQGASSGTEGMKLAASSVFDVVLMDLMLPDIDGHSLLEQLRTRLPETPILVISALNEVEEIVACLEAGAEDYLSKPFIPALLRVRVASAIERKRYRELQRAMKDQPSPAPAAGSLIADKPSGPARTLSTVVLAGFMVLSSATLWIPTPLYSHAKAQLTTGTPPAQMDRNWAAMRQRLDAVGSDPSRSQEFLRQLSLLHPNRLTASSGLERASRWVEAKMRQAGLENVHRESFELPQGWRRGSARGRIVGPGSTELVVRSYGWTGSTPGRIEAETLRVSPADVPDRSWTGKALLVDLNPGDAAGFYAMPDLVQRAATARAAAVLVRDTRPGPVHTGPLGYPGATSPLPVLIVDGASMDAIESAVSSAGVAGAKGAGPRLELDVRNTFSKGPVRSWNVCGELPGRDAQAGAVLLGAHLDAWDLSPGISDDGYGMAAVLDAAHRLHATGLRPRRTVRVVFFTGEEQGLVGSRAYVSRHAAELGRLQGALVVDWGSGPITAVAASGHEELIEPLGSLLRDAAPGIGVGHGYMLFTDGFAFTAAGIAGISFLQDSPGYTRIGHSGEDTLTHVEPATLRANGTLLALLAYALAEPQPPMARRLTPKETRQSMDKIQAPAAFYDFVASQQSPTGDQWQSQPGWKPPR